MRSGIAHQTAWPKARRARRSWSMIVALGSLTAGAAHADAITSLALEPAPAGDPGIAVERAAVKGEGLLTVRFLGDIARRPLVVANRRGDTDNILDSQIWLHTLVTYAVASRISFHLDLPTLLGQTEGDHPSSGRAAPGPDVASAIGDVRLGVRWALLAPTRRAARGYDVALAAAGWVPTGRDAYTSDGTVRGAAAVIADGALGALYWAASAGVRGRPPVRLGFSTPVRSGTALTLAAAAGVYLDAAHAWTVGPELALGTAFVGEGLFASHGTVVHALLGAQYLSTDGPLEVGVAAGPDIGGGPGSADVRVLLHVGMVPERALPRIADSDGDGVNDDADACVHTRGVRSDDPAKNGCPAIPDTDTDGIADKDDSCPTVFGEASPEPMLNGCPPLPKEAAQSAELRAERIVIDQQVAFVTGSAELLPESDAILGEVARLLEQHPEIELVEVQGHTDERGTVEYNRRLSQERAASVVAWLTAHGIAGQRLVARGYGRERPIADNATEAGMQKNRRVELHVLRTAEQPPAPP